MDQKSATVIIAQDLPGLRMPDGTIYAGISPDTGRALYAMPEDAGLTMTFNGAQSYASKLNKEKAHGHNDWHVPTAAELSILCYYYNAIGGFNLISASPASWYRTSSPAGRELTHIRRISDARGEVGMTSARLSVRCVRS